MSKSMRNKIKETEFRNLALYKSWLTVSSWSMSRDEGHGSMDLKVKDLSHGKFFYMECNWTLLCTSSGRPWKRAGRFVDIGKGKGLVFTCVAFLLRSSSGKDESLQKLFESESSSVDDSWLAFLSSKETRNSSWKNTLSIYSEDNPFPDLNINRGLCIERRLRGFSANFSLSSNLVSTV